MIPSTLVTLTLQGYLILNTIVGGQTLGSVSAHLNASLGIVIIALVTLVVRVTLNVSDPHILTIVFSGGFQRIKCLTLVCVSNQSPLAYSIEDDPRYNTFIWIPNLVAFVTMLVVSGRRLAESPLSNPTPVGVPNIMTFGATLAASVVNWSPLMPDQGVYHDHTASAYVTLRVVTI